MLTELKHISSTKKDLVSFGQVIAGVCAVIAIVCAIKGNQAFLTWAIIGVAVLIIRFIHPPILLPFQKVWMGISVILGWIVSHVILCVLFYAGFALIGGIGRLFGKQFLDLDFKSNRDSYWIRRKPGVPEKSSYEKQY
jgi:hypothetical protein